MSRILFIILFIYIPTVFHAQENWMSQAKKLMDSASNDRERFVANDMMFYVHVYNNPDSAIPYARQSMILARKLNTDHALATAYSQWSHYARLTGNHPLALEYVFTAQKFGERSGDPILIANINQTLGEVYLEQGDFKKAIFYSEKKRTVLETLMGQSYTPEDSIVILRNYYNGLYKLSECYEQDGQLDLALKYIRKTESGWAWWGVMWPTAPYTYGKIYSKMGDQEKAIGYYHQGIQSAIYHTVKKDLMDIYLSMGFAQIYLNRLDSCIYYGNKVLEAGKTAKFPLTELKAVELLATAYKTGNKLDSAMIYFEKALVLKDSLFSYEKFSQMKSLEFNEQLRQQELEDELQKRTYQFGLYALLGGILVMAIIAIILYRSNRHKQEARDTIEKAYTELKATQTQLIHSEKMASLGELTAGIAHEIQNPLNFMNNFSEVNKDLLQELKENIDKGKFDDAKLIADDLIGNEEKINHHGKRADSIVKGMLQHSRKSTGEKEPTDINALADEYLRLAFHGMRAKDKSFNAILKTEFDDSIGRINIIPQDIGRVLLNIINNAFYACGERSKRKEKEKEKEKEKGKEKEEGKEEGSGKQKTETGIGRDNTCVASPADKYQPQVSVTTRKKGNQIEVTVSDNGNGIPQKVIDKIFQPFFTTKPTGQGTGLGLSLSYDIVKAHGGEIKVKSVPGDGSEFVISLPVNI